jgi:pyruvate dehydrogenase E1 component alpha subunit
MSKERSGRASTQSRVAPKAAENGRASEDPLVGRYPRKQLVQMLEQMQLIRHFEERAAEQYTKARIGGYIHLNVGEEATVVGSVAALRKTDYLIGSYRTHGHALARGTDPGAVMAELFGREAGTSKGRGGSMHLFDWENRFLGGYGIVGGHLPIAAGLGLAIDYLGGDEAVMCVFGEGATNIGAFHESLNIAKLWGLPVVWVCANNQYAMGHSVEMDSSVTEIYRKAAGYDMPGERVDGMDVLAVRQACEAALERARRERLPSLVECVTYRYRGHSMADQRKYRTEDEIQQWRERDPISWLERRLMQAGMLEEDEAKKIEQHATDVAEKAVKFADESPDPDVADLARYVYSDETGS